MSVRYCPIHYPDSGGIINYRIHNTLRYQFRMRLRPFEKYRYDQSIPKEGEEAPNNCLCYQHYLEIQYYSLAAFYFWLIVILSLIALGIGLFYFSPRRWESTQENVGFIILLLMLFLIPLNFVHWFKSDPNLQIELHSDKLKIEASIDKTLFGYPAIDTTLCAPWDEVKRILIETKPKPHILVSTSGRDHGFKVSRESIQIPERQVTAIGIETLHRLLLAVHTTGSSSLNQAYQEQHGEKPLSWQKILKNLAEETDPGVAFLPR
ncbi:hypothetical protein BSR28_05875 [Boudabousia liubingyangii]|uniref:hypothetical protein n=1 Tax=Boudabousia liubingyangii TaxID=1921764 RepID=UPI00093D0A8B|nr:hypothetical protein [Boudabousia liubingyangii]OKL46948.1 hypothetical protein BSR28_05875 [Boudabousia liubingyangii]